MARYRKIGHRFTVPCLLAASAVLSACGIHIESIAQSPVLSIATAVDTGPSPLASQIFAPCVTATVEPLNNAESTIVDLLVGKDQYRSACAPDPGANIPLTGIIERAPRVLPRRPMVATPPSPQGPAMLVTDELVGAVLTGTGEYWYQPITGPA